MILEDKLYSHEFLHDLWANGKISNRDYFLHHQELKLPYLQFCRRHALEDKEDTANQFFQFLLEQEERDHNVIDK